MLRARLEVDDRHAARLDVVQDRRRALVDRPGSWSHPCPKTNLATTHAAGCHSSVGYAGPNTDVDAAQLCGPRQDEPGRELA